ncbi:MAG: 3-deoxy-manno-octulosonate cytidylyltransferase [Ignavibacteriales bacterium]|nr:3-deoxy-manno-octulosonate cytidylyltransferase [Ignavibacteriales bacterium]
MRIAGIIPARYASQRFPGKPLAMIAGKPMIRHVYEQARQSALLTDVIVATDDVRIADVVKDFGGTAVMTSDTLQSGSDRIALAARDLPLDIVVNIQGDEPLIPPAMIDAAVRLLLDDPAAVAGTVVRRITSDADLHNPNVVKVVLSADRRALYFSRAAIPFLRDAAESDALHTAHPFYKHHGLYVYRADFLQRFASLPQTPLEKSEKLEQLRILENGYAISVLITELDSVSVDTPEDADRVQAIMNTRTPSGAEAST